MNLIPRINGPIQLGNETYTFTLPLTYAGSCEAADQFPMEISDAPVLTFENADLPAEGYTIDIALGKIVIKSAGEAGKYYGLQTLFQLLREGKGTLTTGSLSDAPRYAYRGFMWDVSRHFFTVDEVKKVIDQMARLKMNSFHWHLSDDQGFRIESKKFPKLNEIGAVRADERGSGYYTQEEIKEVVAYAEAHHIDVIPEIDLPGHTTAIIAAYPEMSCSGEPVQVGVGGGIYSRILCGGDEKVYEFLYELLDEVLPLFKSEYFHLGGDEAPKAEWKKCPKCQTRMAQLGLEGEEELQAYFTAQLVDFLKSRGKKAIVWNEALASGKLEPTAVAQYWKEWGPSYSYPEVAKGRKFIMSNNEEFYFDYPHAMVSLKGTYVYEPAMQEYTDIPAESVWGLESPLWCERVTSFEIACKQIFPRMCALAENCWTKPELKNYDELLERLEEQKCYWEDGGVAYSTVAEATVHGEEGFKQAMATMQAMMGGGQQIEMPPELREFMMTAGRKFILGMLKYTYTPEELAKMEELLLGSRG
ncbi:MAG: beta-N-acetylhexosaminidase [Firmicutes bacterium]|nr:beta-N-acetylhexosaminidase [Bacillota bacterium]